MIAKSMILVMATTSRQQISVERGNSKNSYSFTYLLSSRHQNDKSVHSTFSSWDIPPVEAFPPHCRNISPSLRLRDQQATSDDEISANLLRCKTVVSVVINRMGMFLPPKWHRYNLEIQRILGLAGVYKNRFSKLGAC